MVLAVAKGGKALWYLTRGTGLMALLLLTASMVLGIVEVNRWQSPRWPRFVTAGLHRNLSLLAVAFVAAHVATTVVDGFAPIGWLDAVVPFRSPYRPVWLGLGAVAVDLLIALVVTSLLRSRLGYRTWRAVHMTAYACWPVSLVHGLGTGTDVRPGWATAFNLVCLAAMVAALWWRLAEAWDARAPAPGARPATGVVASATVVSVVMPLAVVAWLFTGPRQPGWSRRAGTPSALRRSSSAGPGTAAGAPGTAPGGAIGAVEAAPSNAPTTAPSGAVFRLPASTDLQGRRTQTTDAAGQATVTIDSTLTVLAGARLVIVMHGPVRVDGGLSLRTSQVTAGPASDPSHYQGAVTALRGTQLTLALTGPGTERVVALVRLTITGGAVTGTMTTTDSGA